MWVLSWGLNCSHPPALHLIPVQTEWQGQHPTGFMSRRLVLEGYRTAVRVIAFLTALCFFLGLLCVLNF